MRRIAAVVLIIALVCSGIMFAGPVKSHELEPHDYTIYQVSTGETVAVNNDTSQIEMNGTSAGEVIQQAIDASHNGNITIESGNYDIVSSIHTSGTSIRGVGNSTKLTAHLGLDEAVIIITDQAEGLFKGQAVVE